MLAKKKFSDDEFSDIEIALLEQVASKFRNSTADELINLTHRRHSPWYITAQKNGLLEPFEKGLASTSDVEIDLSIMLADDQDKLRVYNGYKEFLDHSRRLKI